LYVIFWFFYVIFVVFAVIRVITALFLKNTIKMADSDQEMMLMQKMREKQRMISHIKAFLAEADTNKSGTLDRREFHEAVNDEEMTKAFRAIGLELHEVEGLFNVLDDGSGELSYDDFISACMHMTGSAKAIDSLLIMSEQRRIRSKVEAIRVDIKAMSANAKKKKAARP